MRGMAVGAMVGAAAMLAAAPADAREREFVAQLSATGNVSVTWHGDRALGCAAAGLCGYRGSTSTEAVDGQIYLTLGRHDLLDAFGYLEPETPSLVRVQRREESGALDACVDVAPPQELDLTVRRAGPGAVRVGLGGTGLAAGRCAGPDLTDALLKIPERRVSVTRLRHGRTTLDLSTRVPFRSGRFSGRLVSTMRLHVGRVTGSRNLIDEPPDRPTRVRRLARVAELHAVYRVTSLAGKFAATFRGLEAPACSSADACGVSGAADWAILSSGGTVVIDASALARGSDHGLRGLFAAVRRPGSRAHVSAYADLRHEAGTTSARVERSGGATCHDSHSARPPYLLANASRTGARFVLGKANVYPQFGDLLRAGCPGPTEAGVLGRGAVASGRLPLAALAQRRITLPLRADGRFDDGAYRGARRSRFTMRLERVRERLTYRFRRVAR